MEELITSYFRSAFPNGHPAFLPTLLKMARLHSDKNHDYAGGGDPLGNFNRVAAILKQYPGFPVDSPTGVKLVYALKQVDAVLWGLSQKIDHKVEGLEGRLMDIAVYMLLALIDLRPSRTSPSQES